MALFKLSSAKCMSLKDMQRIIMIESYVCCSFVSFDDLITSLFRGSRYVHSPRKA
jgi:hypothetical protein